MAKSKTAKFLKLAQLTLHSRLSAGWEVEQSNNKFRLLRRFPWGYGAVGPVMTYRGLPSCNVLLMYGVQHAAIESLLRKIDEGRGRKPLDVCHTYQDTRNRPLHGGQGTALVSDYNHPTLGPVIDALLGERGEYELLDLFDRYADLHSLRATLENDEHVFFSLGCERVIVAIDVVLGDFEHLNEYRSKNASTTRHRLIEEAVIALAPN